MRVTAVVVIVVIVAGGAGPTGWPEDGVTGRQGQPAPATVLRRDGAGREVRVPARPSRIVSLAPSVTELLFALGAGDRVAGVTDFCRYPPEAASRTSIGGLIHPDLERIASLRPDLAVASTSGNYREDAERIERLGIPVYTLHVASVAGMLQSLGEAGRLIGEEAAAARLESGLRARVERVREAAARRPRTRALFVIEPEPLIAPGPATFVGEALRLAGLDLVTGGADSGWNQIDFEQVVALAPELILATAAHETWAKGLPQDPEWKRVRAAREGRVRVISDAIQHPGPRLVDGMEEVAALLAALGK